MSSILDVPGSAVSLDHVGTLEPVEVLIDIDGPRLFLARTPDGEDLLWSTSSPRRRAANAGSLFRPTGRCSSSSALGRSRCSTFCASRGLGS